MAALAPRDLVRLPGLGESLALGIASAGWQRPPRAPPLLLEQVPGIGAQIASGVRASLEAAWLRGEPWALRAARAAPSAARDDGSAP